MSRVSMNVEAAGKVADSLNDIAGELDQRASEIDGILDDAGKDADAPRTARNTARLYGAISEDIRTASRCCKRLIDSTGLRAPRRHH
jgi:uncharacterized protein (UPF0147 family)